MPTLLARFKIDRRTFRKNHVGLFFQYAHLYIRKSECRFMVFLKLLFLFFMNMRTYTLRIAMWDFSYFKITLLATYKRALCKKHKVKLIHLLSEVSELVIFDGK
jgi:hypothetical protein